MALGKGIGRAGLFDLASGDVRQRVRRTLSHRIKVPHHSRPRSRAAAPAVWRQRCHPTHSGSPRVDIRRYGSADARRRHRETGREIVILCDLLCWNSQQRRPDLSRYLGMIVHLSISSLPAHQAERQGLSDQAWSISISVRSPAGFTQTVGPTVQQSPGQSPLLCWHQQAFRSNVRKPKTQRSPDPMRGR